MVTFSLPIFHTFAQAPSSQLFNAQMFIYFPVDRKVLICNRDLGTCRIARRGKKVLAAGGRAVIEEEYYILRKWLLIERVNS